MATVLTSGIAGHPLKKSGRQDDASGSYTLSKIFHEDGRQREVDGDSRDVVRGRYKRPRRHGWIDAHPLQDNRHEGGHAGGNEKRRDQRNPDDDAEKSLVPDPPDQR